MGGRGRASNVPRSVDWSDRPNPMGALCSNGGRGLSTWTGPLDRLRIGDIEDLKLGSATFPRYVRSLGPDVDGPAFIDHVRSLAGDVGQESVPSA